MSMDGSAEKAGPVEVESRQSDAGGEDDQAADFKPGQGLFFLDGLLNLGGHVGFLSLLWLSV